MALIRKIPIREKIFTENDLFQLLELIARRVPEVEHKYRSHYFRGNFETDELTKTTLDSVPKSFAPYLDRHLERVNVLVRNADENEIELDLQHGKGWSNELKISGPEEDWVNATHRELTEFLQRIAPQNSANRRTVYALAVVFWVTFSNIIAGIVVIALNMPRTAGSRISYLWFIMAVLALPLISAISRVREGLFPIVELQTGPAHTWREHQRRKLLWVAAGILLFAPLSNAVYDLYKMLAQN